MANVATESLFLIKKQTQHDSSDIRFYFFLLFFITPYTAAHTNTIKIQKKLKYN